MAREALGLIEVKGYLGAIVAADLALKAANVKLLNIENVKAGLNTVQLSGDIGAVKAAVSAAVEFVKDKPYYKGSHVIARVDDQTAKILVSKKKPKKEEAKKAVEEPVTEPVKLAPVVEEAVTESADLPLAKEDVTSQAPSGKYKREELEKLKVVELRKIAYREEKITLSKKEIKFGNKVTLLNALLNL